MLEREGETDRQGGGERERRERGKEREGREQIREGGRQSDAIG